jgi:threonine dehydrogenase-like Zn-dependent dehydrogenase
MGTPWDRVASTYLEEWVPRFVPYHLDLVRELALAVGQRALVTSSGPGAEVLAMARAVGDAGHVRATDPNEDMVHLCRERVQNATFRNVVCERAELDDVGAGGWHAVVCAFGLWRVEDRVPVLRRWAGSLTRTGKVGVLTYGPPEEADPFELLARSLRELEPETVARPPRIEAERDAMDRMFASAGLVMVRHGVLRHTVSFPSCEAFAAAIREGRTWRGVWDELGKERMGRVLAHFYDKLGGPTAPLVFEPAVTLAIAAQPGTEVELGTRSSVKVPPLTRA